MGMMGYDNQGIEICPYRNGWIIFATWEWIRLWKLEWITIKDGMETNRGKEYKNIIWCTILIKIDWLILIIPCDPI